MTTFIPTPDQLANRMRDQGAALIGYGFSADVVGRSVQDKLDEVVSIFDFEAVGDGFHDDTPAFVAAVNHAAETGDAIHIPATPKGYIITEVRLESLTGIKIFGDGINQTLLTQKVGSTKSAFVLIDCVNCEITGLTIDSANATNESGIRMFCTQNCTLREVEVKNGDRQSFLISGAVGTLDAEDNRVIDCVARDQRRFTNGTAQFTCGANAARTLFDRCWSFGVSSGADAPDLFDADQGSSTTFSNCFAIGHADAGVAFTPGGFMSEGNPVGEPDTRYHVRWISCYVRDCKIGFWITQQVIGDIIGCRLYNCGTSGYGIRCAGKRNYIEDVMLDSCCGKLDANEYNSGGIIVETGPTTIKGARFRNSTYFNVNVYSAGDTSAEFASFINCEFDKPVIIKENTGPQNILVTGCDFNYSSYIKHRLLNTSTPKLVLKVRDCRFIDLGITGGKARVLDVMGNSFHAIGAYAEEAINTTVADAFGSVRHNIFCDYSLAGGVYVNDGAGSDLPFYNNTYAGCAAGVQPDAAADVQNYEVS